MKSVNDTSSLWFSFTTASCILTFRSVNILLAFFSSRMCRIGVIVKLLHLTSFPDLEAP